MQGMKVPMHILNALTPCSITTEWNAEASSANANRPGSCIRPYPHTILL